MNENLNTKTYQDKAKFSDHWGKSNMNQEFSDKCIDIIKMYIPDGVVQSKYDLVKRRDGSDYTDIDFYYYKDIISQDVVSRIIFVFEFATLSKDYVELKPAKRVCGTPSPILAEYENGQLRFTSNNNKDMPFDNETIYTECRFYKKNFKTKECEFHGDYANEDIRKVVAGSLKLLIDAVNEINCPSTTFIVFPIVVTEQNIEAENPVFNYSIGNDMKKLPFLDGVSFKNLEPVNVHIFNVSELNVMLPSFNEIYSLMRILHDAGPELVRMMFDPFIEEIKQDDKNY